MYFKIAVNMVHVLSNKHEIPRIHVGVCDARDLRKTIKSAIYLSQFLIFLFQT